MDESILRYLAGDADQLERRRLERWIEASDANRARFHEIQGVWTRTDLGPRPPGPPPDVRVVVEEAERRRASGTQRRRRHRGRRLAAALGLATAAAVVAVLLPTGEAMEDGPALLEPVASVTGVGQAVTMSLSDGSVLRLAPGSSVDIPPTMDRREVVLSGRAFFAVAEEETPFVVRTAAGTVTVHGTRFEVREQETGVRVVVVEGRVRLASTSGAEVEVLSGEVADVSEGRPPRVTRASDVWALLDWEGGILLFQETPLGEVAQELTRHFSRRVTLADRTLAARRITAWFGEETLDEVVADLCLVAGVACTTTEDGAVLGR